MIRLLVLLVFLCAFSPAGSPVKSPATSPVFSDATADVEVSSNPTYSGIRIEFVNDSWTQLTGLAVMDEYGRMINDELTNVAGDISNDLAALLLVNTHTIAPITEVLEQQQSSYKAAQLNGLMPLTQVVKIPILNSQRIPLCVIFT